MVSLKQCRSYTIYKEYRDYIKDKQYKLSAKLPVSWFLKSTSPGGWGRGAPMIFFCVRFAAVTYIHFYIYNSALLSSPTYYLLRPRLPHAYHNSAHTHTHTHTHTNGSEVKSKEHQYFSINLLAEDSPPPSLLHTHTLVISVHNT